MALNRLLILDDDPGALNFLGEVGRQCRYDVELTRSVDELEAAYGHFRPSMIILDLQYDEGDAIEVMSFLARHGCQAPIVLITGYDARVLDAARRIGLEHGLMIVGASRKPVLFEELVPLLEAHREPELDEWADELRGAIVRGELTTFYQPKVQIADGRVVGFEALARWFHPTRGLILPDRFIPLAEETGLMGLLTEHVLGRSVADCADWAAHGYPLSVAINLSLTIFTRDGLLEQLSSILAQHALSPSRLTLEITESATMHHPLLTVELLSRLRLRGYNVALDDFGTGYSNLSVLHQLPVNELKIDKSLMIGIESNPDAQVIVRAIADLAKQLGLTTVAEGIEDLRMIHLLRSMGIEQVQGYGIAQPMPSYHVLAWLEAWSHNPSFSADTAG